MIELEQQEQQPLQQQLKQSVGHVYYNGIWRNWQVVHLIRLLSLSVHFFRYFLFLTSHFPSAALISCAYCRTISHAHRPTEITSIFIMAASAACGVQQDLSGVDSSSPQPAWGCDSKGVADGDGDGKCDCGYV